MFLHGWGTTRSIWDNFAGSLSCFNDVSMVCIYEAANKTNDYSFESIAKVINKQINSNTVLVVWSIGGLVATPLAKLSEKIKAVVYISSSPCFVNQDTWSNVIDKSGVEDLQQRLIKNQKKALEYFAGLIAYGDESEKKTIKTLREYMRVDHHVEILSSWLSQMQTSDQRNDFSQIRIPIKYILGGNDSLIKPGIKDQLGQLNQNIESCVIEGSGHAPFLSKKEIAAEIINEFINARA